MYPIFKPVDRKHFAPTELRDNSKPAFQKHFVPTGVFKKITLNLTAISERSATDSSKIVDVGSRLQTARAGKKRALPVLVLCRRWPARYLCPRSRPQTARNRPSR